MTVNPNKSTVFPSPRLTFAAAPFVKLAKEKNFCNADCATTALSRFSCCRIYKTATRAKSSTSSVITNVAPELKLAAEDVVVGATEEDAGEEENADVTAAPVGAGLESKIIPLDVAIASAEVLDDVTESRRSKPAFALAATTTLEALLVAVDADDVVVVVGITTSLACPTRSDCPSNVTRAFSVAQDIFAELKRATILLAERGME